MDAFKNTQPHHLYYGIFLVFFWGDGEPLVKVMGLEEGFAPRSEKYCFEAAGPGTNVGVAITRLRMPSKFKKSAIIPRMFPAVQGYPRTRISGNSVFTENPPFPTS